MDAHIWPSLYPAMVVGLLVSFTCSGQIGWMKAIIGTLGGLIGGAGAYFTLIALGLGAGPTGSIGTMAAAGLVAWIAVKCLEATNRRLAARTLKNPSG